MSRADFPTRADLDAASAGGLVCPRCGHKHHGMSREDFDAMIRDGAQKIADRIDRQTVAVAYASLRLNP